MDFSLLYAIQAIHSPFLDALMLTVTKLGDKGLIWILINLFLLLSKRTRPLGVAMAVALVLNQTLGSLVLKPLIARPRPCWLDPSVALLLPAPHDFSFPSGHSAASFLSATVLLAGRHPLAWLAVPMAILIAFSRLYLFVHFPSDVLAGALMGIALGGAAAYFYKRYLQKKNDPMPF